MAMELLQAGVDRAVIALWLGHESVETTQIYLDANLALKEAILAKTTPPEGKPGAIEPTTNCWRSSKRCDPKRQTMPGGKVHARAIAGQQRPLGVFQRCDRPGSPTTSANGALQLSD